MVERELLLAALTACQAVPNTLVRNEKRMGWWIRRRRSVKMNVKCQPEVTTCPRRSAVSATIR